MKTVSIILLLLASTFSGCAPKTESRDESLAVTVMSILRDYEKKDDRPYLITLRSVSGNFDLKARKRILSNLEARGFSFVDALVVDPKSEFKWGADLKKFRSLIEFEIVSWVSDDEVIIRTSNTPAALGGMGGTTRLKRKNGKWEAVESIESWVS